MSAGLLTPSVMTQASTRYGANIPSVAQDENMASKSPGVSFVVPVFNESREVLEESLGSVTAQTFEDFECIVIDESTDTRASAACREICERDPRFVYVHPDERIGLAASLNLGISMARAPLIARFDSDDICMPGRLAAQTRFMAEHQDVGVLGGGLEIMDESGSTLSFRDYASDHRTIEKRFHTTTSVAHPTVMMRKRVLDEFGSYNPDFRFSEDLDLWLRLLNSGVRFANLDEVLVRYRQQNTQRNPKHWRYNLRARTSNFKLRYVGRRTLGVVAIAVWGRLPTGFQKAVFRMLLLRAK
jgi:glycosyltransferase involved in cell wall biosynthesis